MPSTTNHSYYELPHLTYQCHKLTYTPYAPLTKTGQTPPSLPPFLNYTTT